MLTCWTINGFFQNLGRVSCLLVLMGIFGGDTHIWAQARDGGKQVELPITRVVLYSSGVSYFEHNGQIDGDGVVRLMFKADQINDVLKSMVLLDLDGGAVTTVAYASREPVERALSSFGVDLSKDPSLAKLLKQLRGASVTVDKISGKIVTVDQRVVLSGSPAVQTTQDILRIVTTQGIQSVELSKVQRLQLQDSKLQTELNEALALLIGSRDKNRKAVDVRFAGKGSRRVRIGYLVETPVWKTSYRLDLTDKPMLQGWSIVENATDGDWKNVKLSLISGRPISFKMDLYTAMFLNRPTVQLPKYAMLRPRLYEDGIQLPQEEQQLAVVELKKEMRESLSKAEVANRYFRGDSAIVAQMPARVAGGFVFRRSSAAKGSFAAELFRFDIKYPVSMARRRSAMLPIVQELVKAERVSIYNTDVLDTNPLNGVYLTNTAGMKLPAGPITVFVGGIYAGDAQIGHLTPNEKRLLSYAVDLAVRVDGSIKSETKITAVKIVKGVLAISHLKTSSRVYKVKNKAGDKRVLIFEHPIHAGRELISPKKFEEKTERYYRFRVPIDAVSSGVFEVKEQQVTSQTVALLNSSDRSFLAFMNNGEIAGPVRDALVEVAKMKAAVTLSQMQLRKLEAHKSTLEKGQERLRKNLDAVGKETELGMRYLSKLNAEEDQLENLAKDIVAARLAVAQLNEDLEVHINGLNVK